ncbi:hypothetical protein B0T11DRAFT_359722, partial [Plectosphaerella cucumerina]
LRAPFGPSETHHHLKVSCAWHSVGKPHQHRHHIKRWMTTAVEEPGRTALAFFVRDPSLRRSRVQCRHCHSFLFSIPPEPMPTMAVPSRSTQSVGLRRIASLHPSPKKTLQTDTAANDSSVLEHSCDSSTLNKTGPDDPAPDGVMATTTQVSPRDETQRRCRHVTALGAPGPGTDRPSAGFRGGHTGPTGLDKGPEKRQILAPYAVAFFR